MRLLGKLFLFVFVSALVVIGSILVTFRVQSLRRETRVRTDAAPTTGKFVKAGDVEIYVQETGPITGKPVILVHGFGAWSETWRETMVALANAGFRAIAVDMPPFGFSERPMQKAYTRKDQAMRILGAMNSLLIDKATIVGHSFGGRSVVEAVMQAPGRFDGMVLADVALDLQRMPDWKAETLSRVLRIAPISDAVVTTAVTNPLFSKPLFEKFVADPSVVTDARLQIYQRPLEVVGTTSKVSEWMQVFLTPEEPTLSTDRRLYGALKIPTLVLWGDADTVTPLEQGQDIHSLIPGSKFVVLEGVGHIPQIENLEKFNAALLAFLGGK